MPEAVPCETRPPGGCSSGGGCGAPGGGVAGAWGWKMLVGGATGTRFTPPGGCCGAGCPGAVPGAATVGSPFSPGRRPRGSRCRRRRIASWISSGVPSLLSNGPSTSDSTRGLPPRKVMFCSVPTQIGSRSSCVISALRTMWGVSVRITSVRAPSWCLSENRRPSRGMSESPGMPRSVLFSSVRIRPARKLVSPSLRRITESIMRVPMIGCDSPLEPWTLPLTSDTSIFSLSVTSWLWWTRGSISILMPTSWYWNEVIGMMPPELPAFWVLNVVNGIGRRSPITRFAFSPSLMRICGLARSLASVFCLTKL